MKRRTKPASHVAGTSLLLCVLVLASSAAAVPPTDLDPTFGAAGIVTTDFGGTGDEGWGVAVQPDGKIVVAGGRNAGPDFDADDYLLARYLPDGGLDPSFGAGGRVVTDFGGPRDEANDVALQPDGRILAAGWSHAPGAAGDMSVARYLPNGTLDPSFDGDGRVTVDLGGDDFAAAIILQPDGKIVLAGGTATVAAVVRLSANGSLDMSFSGDGKALVQVGAGNGELSVARDVAIGPAGAIVLGGARCNPTCFDFAAARLSPDGTLDPTFSGDGIAQIDVFTPNDTASAVAVAGDGSVVLVGSAGNDGALARLLPSGEPDASFGIGGRIRVRRVANETLSFADVAVLASGRILVAGAAFGPTGATFGDLLVARFLPDGGHDVGFSEDGRALVDVGGRHQFGAALAVQEDGKVLVAGLDIPSSFATTAADVVVARFLPNGSTVPPPPGRIRGDQSDFGVGGVAGAGVGVDFVHGLDVAVGDSGPAACNSGRRAILRFDLRALRGLPLRTATLTMTITQSRRDQFPAPGIIDGTPPFANPGLGAIRVLHIADQPAPNVAAYGTPSIGDDPGILVADGVEPPAKVSVDVTAALNHALAAGASFASFRVESALETDGDCLNDLFFFRMGDDFEPENRPFIDYELGDAAPPVLTASDQVDADATSPDGARVDFAVTARDETDPAPTVECRPASGSLFPVGNTQVTCTARDATGNTSTKDFVVHVRGATEQLARLRELIAKASLHAGHANALDAKLAAAERAIARDQAHVACALLGAFEGEVAALDPPDAVVLAGASARIRAVLDCSGRGA